MRDGYIDSAVFDPRSQTEELKELVQHHKTHPGARDALRRAQRPGERLNGCSRIIRRLAAVPSTS